MLHAINICIIESIYDPTKRALQSPLTVSIAAIFVEISRLEMVLMMECQGVPCAGVCAVPGNLLPCSSHFENHSSV